MYAGGNPRSSLHGRAGRSGVDRDVGTADAIPEVRAPSDLVRAPVPHLRRRDLLGGLARVAVVDHRVHEVLEGDRHLTAVAREQHRARGEPTARARAADGQAGPIDAEVVEAVGKPAEAQVAVVDVRGVLVLGREAVVDGHDEASEVAGPRLAHEVVTVERADDHAAAVDPEQRWRTVRPVCGFMTRARRPRPDEWSVTVTSGIGGSAARSGAS